MNLVVIHKESLNGRTGGDLICPEHGWAARSDGAIRKKVTIRTPRTAGRPVEQGFNAGITDSAGNSAGQNMCYLPVVA